MWQLTAKIGKRKGRSWPISDKPITVGRDTSCDIILRDPLVSREHCRIEYVDGELILEDLGSSNCTILNGDTVSRCALAIGDELVVGEAVFMVTRSGVDDQSTGTAISLHTTQQFTVGASTVVRDLEAESGTLNVRELAQLNALANELAGSRNTEDLFRAVTKCVNTHCAPPEFFLAKSNGRLNVLSFPTGVGLEADVLERLERFTSDAPLKSQFEIRRTQDGSEVFTSFIPLRVGDAFVGVLGGSQRKTKNSDPVPDLLFAKSIARLVAPFLVAIGDGSDLTASRLQLGKAEATFLGESEAAKKARRLIAIAATADLPVLLQGPTGTGKELAAHLIHELSDRSNGPLAIANCAAISEELFESELFGHVKGAFTDAISDREGLLSEAHGGHLFLDEIADLCARNQARILRAVESCQFRPVGASKDRVAQFTVIAATNRDLVAAVNAGDFREDLYYRLGGIEIYLPPLSERRSDIPLLIEYFSDEYAKRRGTRVTTFDTGAVNWLSARPWPGNVRELRNSIGKVSSFAPAQHVSQKYAEAILSRHRQVDGESTRRIEDVERTHIEQVLTECGGRIIDAAAVLGMHRNTLSKKLKKYHLSE